MVRHPSGRWRVHRQGEPTHCRVVGNGDIVRIRLLGMDSLQQDDWRTSRVLQGNCEGKLLGQSDVSENRPVVVGSQRSPVKRDGRTRNYFVDFHAHFHYYIIIYLQFINGHCVIHPDDRMTYQKN